MIPFPQPLARMIERLPAWPPSFVFTRVLNLLLRNSVQKGSLAELEGKRIVIRVTDTGRIFNTCPALSECGSSSKIL